MESGIGRLKRLSERMRGKAAPSKKSRVHPGYCMRASELLSGTDVSSKVPDLSNTGTTDSTDERVSIEGVVKMKAQYIEKLRSSEEYTRLASRSGGERTVSFLLAQEEEGNTPFYPILRYEANWSTLQEMIRKDHRCWARVIIDRSPGIVRIYVEMEI